MRIGDNPVLNSVTSGQNVKNAFGIFAFKKANQMQAEGALKLIQSMPKIQTLKGKVDINA